MRRWFIAFFVFISSFFSSCANGLVYASVLPPTSVLVQKPLSEVFGELAFNMLGVDLSTYTPVQREMFELTLGGRLFNRLGARGVSLHSILSKLYPDGSSDWSDLSDVVVYSGDGYDGENGVSVDGGALDITVTNDFVSALAEAVPTMPEYLSSGLTPDDSFTQISSRDVWVNTNIRRLKYGPVISESMIKITDQDDYGYEFLFEVSPTNFARLSDGGLDYDKLSAVAQYVVDGGAYVSDSMQHAYDKDGRSYLYFLSYPHISDSLPVGSSWVFRSYSYNFLLSQGGNVNVKVYYRLVPSDGVYNMVSRDDLFNNTYGGFNFGDMNSKALYDYLNSEYSKDFDVSHLLQNNYTNGDFYGDYNLAPNATGSSSNVSWFQRIYNALVDIPATFKRFYNNFVNLLVPTDMQMYDLTNSYNDVKKVFMSKFGDILSIPQQLGGLYEASNDKFDMFAGLYKGPYFGQDHPAKIRLTVPVIPILGVEPGTVVSIPNINAGEWRNAIRYMRTVTGAGFSIYVAISIYKRIVGSGDVIK